jgi:hypothetical protein
VQDTDAGIEGSLEECSSWPWESQLQAACSIFCPVCYPWCPIQVLQVDLDPGRGNYVSKRADSDARRLV